MTSDAADHPDHGLVLRPFAGLRPTAEGDALAELLCPPYDVIDSQVKSSLLARNSHNAVAVVLPEPTPAGYREASQRLADDLAGGLLAVDAVETLYVYQMEDAAGSITRGFLGAVELRAPEDGVILPHENTMAGPVADRLAVMTETGTDLEPIYLIYDGGGPASHLLDQVGRRDPVARAHTDDGLTHTLWAITSPDEIDVVSADLASRRALIADGHHRYATYRERQRIRRASDGPGPWDYGLALLVDSTTYGPQVHAIHRVVPALALDDAVGALGAVSGVELSALTFTDHAAADELLAALPAAAGFAAVLTDGTSAVLVADGDKGLAALAERAGDVAALAELDVSVLHRAVVERVWQLPDDVDHVGYAHTPGEAVEAARRSGGIAVLMRPTPAAAVAAVAAQGGRMPRKSTFFTPKPASGLVMRRLVDADR